MDLQGSEQLELDQEDRNFADSGSPIEQQRVGVTMSCGS